MSNNKSNDDKKDNNEIRKPLSPKENLEMSLKAVLRKKRISIVKQKEDQILDLVRDEIDNDEMKEVENPKLLFYFLSNTPVFKQYIYIHNFTQENLINSFRFGKYVKLKKDTILFRQGDKTDYFYLILSGCIGFILTTYDDIALKINPYSREVNSIRVGSYFGEWGLIYKINRTVSAYAKEDTLLLGFDKFAFKTFYQDNIILSESYSKKFVLKHIMTFKELNETSFNIYYREIKKIYCIPGKEIFLEGAKADSFYLVYKGSCTVRKGLTNLIIKDSGDFIGIESLYSKKYESSIYPYTDGTVLFKFLLNSFNETIVYNLKTEFEEYYKNQKIILKNSYENYNKYKDKYQMSFVNLLENLKKNKEKNNKRIIDVKIDDIKTNSNIYENKHYSSPYKVIKLVNYGDINKNKSKNNIVFDSSNRSNSIFPKSKNICEETKFLKYLKYYNESAYNLIKSDMNDTNSAINIDSFRTRKTKTNIKNSKNQKLDKNIRPYSTLTKEKDSNKLNFPKKHCNFFYEEINTNTKSFLNRVRRDNHFSSQNFRIKKNKKLPLTTKNKMIKNKSSNNIIRKKYFNPIFVSSKNILDIDKNLIKKRTLKKNYSQWELKIKGNNNNENRKNIDYETNPEIPIMIIRNVSFFPTKMK